MKKELQPSWSKEDRLKGKRMHRAWEQFFSGAQQTEKGTGDSVSGLAEDQRISSTLLKFQADLLRYPNVIGVAEGIRTRRGKPTGDRCLVVYVNRKFPVTQLRPSEVLPSELEGIQVDVVEVGEVAPLDL